MPASGSNVFGILPNSISNHNVLQFPNLLCAPKKGGVMPPNAPVLHPAAQKGDTPALKGKKDHGKNVSKALRWCDTSQHRAESTPALVLPAQGGVNAQACQQAQRPGTSAQVVANMVGLRRKGYSFRRIGREVGRCMEGVRQVLMRYEDALTAQAPAHAPQPKGYAELVRDPEPLPAGHPIAMRGLWKGLERWQPTQAHATPTTWQQDEAALAQALLWNGGAA
ncbi:hypothetical protein [Acetobacter oryzifermentans]|uniref:Transposase n=1 Tax=Acetobacter oryzifermentans TaxID=1633874 RepID=A0ABN4NN06_9PROT|nr:hypothetical protein [Acetobacter oryzifermentans]ANA13133.1 hypothetical protein WG31_03180 [Acetobacter oryzifermentans]